MRTIRAMLAMAALLPATGGCVKTVWNVATLPVRVVGSGVDAVTTSPKERDEKYVRAMRKRDEREARERKQHDEQCRRHRDACGPYTGYRARDDDRR